LSITTSLYVRRICKQRIALDTLRLNGIQLLGNTCPDTLLQLLTSIIGNPWLDSITAR
jgi:hypothetical protein